MSGYVGFDVPEERGTTPVSDDERGVGHSRGDLLKKGALAGGALFGGAALLGGLPKLASSAPSPKQDVRIMNFLLLVEYVQAGFYARAVEEAAIEGELLEFARVVGDHERAHIDFLRRRLGGEAREEPELDFGDATGDANAFARTALTLEETGIAAYIGQGANVTKRIVARMASITAVEARHTAWIRAYLGQNAAPRAADVARTSSQVVKSLRDRGFVKSA